LVKGKYKERGERRGGSLCDREREEVITVNASTALLLALLM